MSNYALKWDETGKRFYESGVSKVVLFPYDLLTRTYETGVAWNGITNVTDSPEGADATDHYADNMKYVSIRSLERANGSIEAYSIPNEWLSCIGINSPTNGLFFRQQSRKMFGLCYRTEIGNDVDDEKGYRLHFIYGAAASPSDQSYDTVNESPDAVTRSWNFDTVPIRVSGYKPFSVLEISSLAVDRNLIEQLETIVYGSDDSPSRLPMPDEIISIFFPMYLYKMIELGYITAYIQNDHLFIQYADVAEVEEQYREVYGTFIFPRFENGNITVDVDEYGHLIFIINDLDMIVPSVEEERLVITFE